MPHDARTLVISLSTSPRAQFHDSSQRGHQLSPDSRRKAMGPPDIQRFPERRCGLGKPAFVNFEQADLIEELAAELDLLPCDCGVRDGGNPAPPATWQAPLDPRTG